MILAFAPLGLPITGWIAVVIVLLIHYAHHTRNDHKGHEWKNEGER